MNEYKLILMLLTGGGLWALGGTIWTGLRRYVLPVVLFLLLFWSGVVWWRGLLTVSLLCAVTHLGYGKTVPYWRKFLVGCSYSLPSLVIGFTWWVILIPITFEVTFWLSNWRPTAKDFVWKVCEYLVGTVIVCSLIGASLNQWGY